MQHIFISIIIPTYNSGSTLSRALQSLLDQTYKSFEVLILDGLSTDNTLKIARDFHDDRIRIFSEKDNGIYDAMNKGVDKAKGDWIYFLGSDDELYDNKVLEKIFLDKTNLDFDVIYGQVLLMASNKLYLGQFNAEKLIFQNISHQAIFTKKEVFRRLGKFDVKYEVCADHIFNVKWFFDKHVKKRYIDIVVAKFGQQGLSSQRDEEAKIRDLPLLVKKHAGPLIYFRYYFVRPGILWIMQKIRSCKRLLLRFAPTII